MGKFIVLAILCVTSLTVFAQALDCQVKVDTLKKKDNLFRGSELKLYSQHVSDNLVQYYEEEREVQAKVGHNIIVKIQTNGHVESPVLINVSGVGQMGVDKISGPQERLALPNKNNKISEGFVFTRVSRFRKTSKDYYQHHVKVECNILK